MIKLLLKKIIAKLNSLVSRSVKFDFFSNISPRLAFRLRGSRKFPIRVENSILSGEITAEEGCQFQDCTCFGKIELGKFVSVSGPGTFLCSRIKGIKIGAYSSIARNVTIQEDYHNYKRKSSYFIFHNLFSDRIEKDIFTKGKIIIEEDVWVGANSVILSGIKIGRGSIIGAGSVITKDIPRYSIVAGNPAKVIRKRFSEKTIEKLEKEKWWLKNYKELNEIRNDFILDLTI